MTKLFDERYAQYLNYFNDKLVQYCNENLVTKPEILGESMRYSVLLGGKRIRPVLMFAVGDVLGVDKEKLLPFAIALELIHTYSLIHDDLPEMDDDDYRRGKPSNHKVYGQGNAVLAGDGLLNTAYSLLFSQCFKGDEYISAAKFICDCAGIGGMIAGQSADLKYENSQPNEDILDFIYENKTAKLITAAMVVPSIFKGGESFSELQALGKITGYLFQLTDDILDVCGKFAHLGKSIGKDDAEGKLSAVRLYGIDDCRLRADMVGDNCLKIIDGLNGDCSFLYEFINFIKSRLG